MTDKLIPEGFRKLDISDDFVGLIGPLWFKAEGERLRVGLPLFRVVVGRLEVDFKRQMFYPGRATACARLIEAHERKCVIGHGLFDGEGNCTAVLRAIMVSLNEETHRATPFDPAVRAALDRLATSADGLPI